MSKKRRRSGRKFIMIDAFIINSPAWQSLSPNEITAYLAFKWAYDGQNNGRIAMSVRDLAARLNAGKDTARRAVQGLVDKGFIEITRCSGFNMKNRRAAEYRLTEYRCDVTGELSTKRFMRWHLQKKAQAQVRDTQAQHRYTEDRLAARKHPDSRGAGTVRPNPLVSQAHHEDTYNTTIEEAAR